MDDAAAAVTLLSVEQAPAGPELRTAIDARAAPTPMTPGERKRGTKSRIRISATTRTAIKPNRRTSDVWCDPPGCPAIEDLVVPTPAGPGPPRGTNVISSTP
jgi:hypothetical protein